MPCTRWNDDWIAWLYDELPAEEAAIARAHCDECPECSATVAALRMTREHLAEYAPPVPLAPRVVVLRPRPWAAHAWVFAAGMACAVIVLALGLELVEPRESDDPTPDTAVEQRLARLEALSREPQVAVSRDVLGEEMNKLARRLQLDRAADLEWMLGEIQAAEWRTGSRIRTNEEAWRYAMLASRPGLSEQ